MWFDLNRLVDRISNILLASLNAIEENSAVTFDGKAYPKDGWAIFTAGGPGSGKSWIIQKQFLIDAKVLDTDNIKEYYIKMLRNKLNDPNIDAKTKANLIGPFGGKIPNLKNPRDSERLHYYTKKRHFFTHMLKTFLRSAVKSHQNFIVDTTGNNIEEVFMNAKAFKSLGYKISIVWVVTNVDLAVQRNMTRSRHVDEAYLRSTHENLAKNIPEALLNNKFKLFDEFWIVFNNEDKSKASDFKSRFKDTAYKLEKVGDSFIITDEIVEKIAINLGRNIGLERGNV